MEANSAEATDEDAKGASVGGHFIDAGPGHGIEKGHSVWCSYSDDEESARATTVRTRLMACTEAGLA